MPPMKGTIGFNGWRSVQESRKTGYFIPETHAVCGWYKLLSEMELTEEQALIAVECGDVLGQKLRNFCSTCLPTALCSGRCAKCFEVNQEPRGRGSGYPVVIRREKVDNYRFRRARPALRLTARSLVLLRSGVVDELPLRQGKAEW
jgi:hypothetical protein